MVKQINKKANFWIRLLATLIDVIIFLIFSVISSFATFDYQNAKLIHNALYYFWLINLILFLLIYFILIPIFAKGKTLGMTICRIKIISTDKTEKFSKAVFNRQRLFSFVWMIIFALFAILISPETFIKASTKGMTKDQLTTVQFGFLMIPIALIGIASFTQLFLIMSNARSNRVGLNDKFSSTETVWINKYEEIEEEEIIERIIKPKKRVLPTLTFKN
ncbi:RDD family [Metamycoplasma cloacale]|uniref:RDD family protein n=1 Tax=Metamycoplasma cloacale TaxID=92401 RepID=A0A2Z4LLA8_9BACT|nr:RDD family protein [Metamycoplasma cloacale]AWX42531.1 RDD family protein [Metamycoplasma cloacale]VEU79123.1 RDD family [Metamycoplasma cloacale]VEU79810.1 RDD family [Metamycoplasma cloacale]